MKSLLMLGLLACSLNTFAQPTHFSGHWKINADKVAWGEAPHFVLPTLILVDQQQATVNTVRTWLDEQGSERLDTANVTIGGKPFEITTYSGKKRMTSCRAGEHKGSLVFTIDTRTPDHQPWSSATETWSLSEDGATLIIDRFVKQNDGSAYPIKGYYDKAK
jgi:hypothetical protein